MEFSRKSARSRFDEMLFYFKQLLQKVFHHAQIGIAFNVMSKHVQWERDDLFHLPFDLLAQFLVAFAKLCLPERLQTLRVLTYVYR